MHFYLTGKQEPFGGEPVAWHGQRDRVGDEVLGAHAFCAQGKKYIFC